MKTPVGRIYDMKMQELAANGLFRTLGDLGSKGLPPDRCLYRLEIDLDSRVIAHPGVGDDAIAWRPPSCP